MKVKINEIFYSLQLEGSYIGYPAVFIRFSGCNLDCDFCDTKYALKDGELKDEMEIYESISHFQTNRIIFTGGEPALYDEFISFFAEKHKNYLFFMETNGTIFIKKSIRYIRHVVVSPKQFAINEDVLKKYKKESRSVEFKFLIDTEKDITNIESISDKLNLYPITLQPVFDNQESIEKYIKKTKMLIEAFKHSGLAKKNARLIMQNHKVIYKEQRGV